MYNPASHRAPGFRRVRATSSVERSPIASKFSASQAFAELAAQIAQRRQESPRRVELALGPVGLQFAVAADAMQELAAIARVFQHPVVDEARNEIGRAQFGEQARVEPDLVRPVADLLRPCGA